MTERLHFHFSLSCIGEGNGNPLQCSCLENPRDGGASWAAIYGVAQSGLDWSNLAAAAAAAPLGAIRGDLERVKFRGGCSDCLGTRCVVFLSSTQHLKSLSFGRKKENEILGVFRVQRGSKVEKWLRWWKELEFDWMSFWESLGFL